MSRAWFHDLGSFSLLAAFIAILREPYQMAESRSKGTDFNPMATGVWFKYGTSPLIRFILHFTASQAAQ